MLGDLAAGPRQACVCLRTSERILDCFGNLDNGEVPLFPSLHIRPGVEGHASLFCLVLLNMIFMCSPPLRTTGVVTRTAARHAAGADGTRVSGQTIALTSGIALAACCRRATSASRPATWGCFGWISRAW